jgi:hypothetical protein
MAKIKHGKIPVLTPPMPRNVVVAYPGKSPKVKKG